MRLLLLASAIALPAGTAAAPAPQGGTPIGPLTSGTMPLIDPTNGAAAECPPISRYHAMRRGGRLMPQQLDELPAADHYKAVYRRIDGCVAPIIANFGVGRNR